jgi:uncharacterized membrane protein YhdT
MHFVIGLVILLVAGFIVTALGFIEGFASGYIYFKGFLTSANVVYIVVFVILAFLVARVIAAIQTRD